MVAKIINACAVLHNIANRHRLPVPELASEDFQGDSNLQVPHLDPLKRSLGPRITRERPTTALTNCTEIVKN